MRTTILAAAAVALSLAGAAMAGEETRRITVTGTGQVEAAPDMATITVGVTHQQTIAGEAMRATSDGVAAMLKRLKDQGIAERDLQTRQLSLNPVWSNHAGNGQRLREITGYVASNNVEVRVRDLASLGGILDALLMDGANNFNGLRFSMQEPGPLQDQARKDAVADAIRKATQLAEAAGVTLGPVVKISENAGNRGGPEHYGALRASADSVPVAAGEIVLTETVSVVFSIAD